MIEFTAPNIGPVKVEMTMQELQDWIAHYVETHHTPPDETAERLDALEKQVVRLLDRTGNPAADDDDSGREAVGDTALDAMRNALDTEGVTQ